MTAAYSPRLIASVTCEVPLVFTALGECRSTWLPKSRNDCVNPCLSSITSTGLGAKTIAAIKRDLAMIPLLKFVSVVVQVLSLGEGVNQDS